MGDDIQPPDLSSLQQPMPNLGPSSEDLLSSLPQLAQQSDPLDQVKQTLAQRYQDLQPRPASGSAVKRLLQNFISGGGEAMMHQAGVMTPEQHRQQILTDLGSVTTAQSNADLHRAIAGQYGSTPITLPDGTQIGVLNKDVAALQGKLAQAAASQANAQTGAQAKVDVAHINQGGGLQLPVSQSTAELAGAPELTGQTLGMGGWKMLNSALRTRGFHVQDMGKSGPNDGMWVVDSGGNRVHQVSPNSLMQTRGESFAKARAEYTPFETVEPGTNIPTTISNMEAIQTGAPKVSFAAQSKLGGQYSLYNDAYGILDKIDALTDKVNLDDPAVRARVTAGYAALKDPTTTGFLSKFTGELAIEAASNLLARQPINNSLTPDERELVLSMAQGKAAATGLRSILGQAGANEMQQRMDSGLFPGGQVAGSSQTIKQQTAATRALLGRVSIGLPQAGLNAPNQPGALSNRNKPTPTVEFKEGNDTYRIPADKVPAFKAKHPKAAPVGG